MQVNVQRISPVVMELSVEVPADTVKAQLDKAYTSLTKSAHIKGFRKGKAPRNVLERVYAPQVASDVANALVQDSLNKALAERSITPITTPQVVEAGNIAAFSTFSYRARFEVQPDIEKVDFEGFELKRPVAVVTDAMVDEQVENLRKQRATVEEPASPRAATDSDVAVIDFVLSVDGAEVKDGGGQGVQLELSSGQVLPELKTAIVGKGVGDKTTAEATFPEAHPNPALRGKKGVFAITVTAVKEKVLPKLDDEFAKDLGAGFDTLDALKADIRSKLEKSAKEQSEVALAEQIVAQLNERNPLDVPPSLVEQQRRLMEAEVAMQARRVGARFTQDQARNLVSQLQADAEKKVRAGLLMAAIARANNFQVTDEDIEKAYGELAEETGQNVARVKAEYRDPQKRQILIGMILEDKILDFIEAKSTIVDAPADGAGASAESETK
jgi:trigger factor